MKTDLEIQRDVMEELLWSPLLKSSEIGVAVKNGIVTLSGMVDTYAKKIEAENSTKKVEGVKAVAEDIEVKISALGLRNDTEIAQAVLNALKWHSSVQEDKIKMKVENGWVTLEGSVEWEFQKNAVKNSIENLFGVRGIINNIKIVPTIAATDIGRKISAAFHRSASIDADRIKIEVLGNKVVLKGKVRSFAEKKDAEHAAWLAPGVSRVENNLDIEIGALAAAY